MAERVASSTDSENKEEYIIYMGSLPRSDYSTKSYHMKILQEVIGESLIEDRLVRSYEKSFNGFAAKLTESEYERLSKLKEVVSVFPNKKLQLQRTMSSKIQRN